MFLQISLFYLKSEPTADIYRITTLVLRYLIDRFAGMLGYLLICESFLPGSRSGFNP